MAIRSDVSTAALWFLVAVISSTLLLVVFFLYITKRACFRGCQGCDRFLEPSYHRAGESLARSFDNSDSNTSSDSEEENIRHLKKSIRRSQSIRASRTSASNEIIASSSESKSYDAISMKEKSFSGSSRDISNQSFVYPEKSSSHQLGDEEQNLSQALSHQSHTKQNFYGSTTSLTSEKGFSRKAVRKSPTTSEHSLITHKNQDWEIEDAESLYQHRGKISPERKDYVTSEIELAQEASKGVRRPSEDEEEYSGPGVEPISVCGTLDISIQYIMSEKKLQVTIIEAHDLPSKARGGASIIQVRTVLLPAKKKRYKTKVQHIRSPRFAETFTLSRASPEDLKGLALRLRMYGIGKVKDRLIGEAIVWFDELNLIREPQFTLQLQLEPRTDINRGDSTTSLSKTDSLSSSMMSLSHGGSPPELLIGLSYNPPTGRLCVEVIKGSHFRNLAMSKAPDTFIKLTLLNSACQEMSHSKTTVRRGQPNPVYKETFYFQVALFQLGEVTLMVSVYNRRTIKKKEMIGWVSMGHNSSSEPDEQHWMEMKEGKGQQVCRWHSLIDS